MDSNQDETKKPLEELAKYGVLSIQHGSKTISLYGMLTGKGTVYSEENYPTDKNKLKELMRSWKR